MNSSRLFTTAKGTELPLLNLKGRDYLEVKFRLVWFREEHPQWSIETEFLAINERSACARAVIKDETGRIIATSHKTESQNNFPDFMEKAETGAIGRALALIGFGTQFCADELDEGERIVDAPVAKKMDYVAPQNQRPNSLNKIPPGEKSLDLGEFQVNFGRKYLGKKLKEIPRQEIVSYLEWLDKNASQSQRKNGPSYEVTMLKEAVDRYYNPEKYSAAEVEASESVAEFEEETATSAAS